VGAAGGLFVGIFVGQQFGYLGVGEPLAGLDGALAGEGLGDALVLVAGGADELGAVGQLVDQRGHVDHGSRAEVDDVHGREGPVAVDEVDDVRTMIDEKESIKRTLTTMKETLDIFSIFKLEIEGNASPTTGDVKTNEQLANERASCMKTVLHEDFGVENNRMTAVGKNTTKANNAGVNGSDPPETQIIYQRTQVHLK